MGRQLTSQTRVFHPPTEMSLAASCIADVAAVFQTIPTAITSWSPEPGVTERLFAHRQLFEGHAPCRMLEVHLGNTQPGVLWKTLTDAADFTSSGMICTALAPRPNDCNPLIAEIVKGLVPSSAVDLFPSYESIPRISGAWLASDTVSGPLAITTERA